MKNSNYWKKRFEQLEDSLHKNAIDVFNENKRNFEIAQKEIEKEIAIWYQRFATNNEISITEAKKWLNASELKELKWNINEYIKYGRENDITSAWMKELENASAKYHISRLEALQLQTRQTIEALYQNELTLVDTMVNKTYSDGYYRTCFEVQKGFNIGWDIGTIDQRKLEKIISTPWTTDGKNFSDRIWQSKSQLISEVQNELTRTCLLGTSPDKAINNIAKKFNTSKNQAGRLIMTEQAYFSSLSQKEAFNELNVEKFENVATLDSHTSAICQDMDGTVFDMKDYEPGVTAPPFHPYCRTVTVPYFEDEYELGERAAKGEDGKTYYVSSDMKYKDWKKQYATESKTTEKVALRNKSDKIKGEWKDFESLEEARSYIDANYVKSDVSKIKNVDSLNVTCKTLDELQDEYPLNYDIYIQTNSNMRKAKAKASYSGITLNTSHFNKANRVAMVGKEWKEYCEAQIKDLEKYLGDARYKQAPIKNSIRQLKMYMDYNSYSISDAYSGLESLKATVAHEYGHIIADQYFGQINHKRANSLYEANIHNECYKKCQIIHDAYIKAWNTDDITKISYYGSTDEYEFFAEVFAKKKMGEELPDYLDEMLERVLKDGK